MQQVWLNFAKWLTVFLPFQNNLTDLDPSCKMDLDVLDSFGREKPIL